MNGHLDRNLLGRREVAIAGFCELERVRGSGRSAIDLAGEVTHGVLEALNISSRDVDGFVLTASLSEADRPFWSNVMADALGLSPRWLQMNDIGGCSPLANISRAALAIQAGYCETVLCLSADALSMQDRSLQGAFRSDFGVRYGDAGPVSAFGLIASSYAERYGYPDRGLARLAVAQRRGALANPLAIAKLRTPLTEEDYLSSRFVSAPLRLLDCGLICDGATAVIVTSSSKAQTLTSQPVYPVSYSELTNYEPWDPQPDITRSGFCVTGPEALDRARLRPDDVAMFQPYDDFLFAVALQLEQIGFCPVGGAGSFLESTDIGPLGRLPINTGGGQISAGQPGLASAGYAIVEAVRQMSGRAEGRQVPNPRNAVVSGIGFLQYARNWGTSAVLVLSQ